MTLTICRLLPALILFCAPAPAAPSSPLVDAGLAIPGLELRIRYAGSDNFVGAPVPGYEAPLCLLTEPAVAALARAQARAESLGLRLRVYDCYRPQRAVDRFVDWAADPDDDATRPTYYPNLEKSDLIRKGYIAERSGHSRGSTVDLTLIRDDGAPLDMGTPWDFFDPRSWTDSPAVSAPARRNRQLLRRIMARSGFSNYAKEWWHYTLDDEPLPDRYLDLPVR
ncbi:MAG: M15 family metallopeptidase [Gammaproteobacteria bacterium]|nr:M15 family metallopeptidase [Gammaproteobacteria bacterium]MCY4342135.1 M15 family metallopeptidase [Gammaproteobacteria bacterium]